MNKKIMTIILILVFVFAMSHVNSFTSKNHDFDGYFTMDVPGDYNFKDVSWCLPNGALGCSDEFTDENRDCLYRNESIIVYYYNDSVLLDGESDVLNHALGTLTSSYFYNYVGNDGELIILTQEYDDMGMFSKYLVGVSNEKDNEVVFVGGPDLGEVKRYAETIEFK